MPTQKPDIGFRRAGELLRKAEKKVALLKFWLIDGIPRDNSGSYVFVPVNQTQFARWEDPSLLVERFNEPNWRREVRADEWHAEKKKKLKADAAIAMSELRNVLNSRDKKEDSIARIRADKKVLSEQNRALVSQLHSLDYEVEKGRGEIQRLEIRLEEANARLAKLTIELAQVRKPTLIKR